MKFSTTAVISVFVASASYGIAEDPLLKEAGLRGVVTGKETPVAEDLLSEAVTERFRVTSFDLNENYYDDDDEKEDFDALFDLFLAEKKERAAIKKNNTKTLHPRGEEQGRRRLYITNSEIQDKIIAEYEEEIDYLLQNAFFDHRHFPFPPIRDRMITREDEVLQDDGMGNICTGRSVVRLELWRILVGSYYEMMRTATVSGITYTGDADPVSDGVSPDPTYTFSGAISFTVSFTKPISIEVRARIIAGLNKCDGPHRDDACGTVTVPIDSITVTFTTEGSIQFIDADGVFDDLFLDVTTWDWDPDTDVSISLGTGTTGDIAFNDPYSAFDAETPLKTAAEEFLAANHDDCPDCYYYTFKEVFSFILAVAFNLDFIDYYDLPCGCVVFKDLQEMEKPTLANFKKLVAEGKKKMAEAATP